MRMSYSVHNVFATLQITIIRIIIYLFFYLFTCLQVQSIVWIGLTITAILAYNCVITIDNTKFNYATVIPTIFMSLYFKGSCPSENMPTFADFISVKTVLDSKDILIWSCVYLGVAVCWIIAAGLIIACKWRNLQVQSHFYKLWRKIEFVLYPKETVRYPYELTHFQ